MLSDKTSTIGENVRRVIDIERSGATISYDYFKEKLLENASNPDKQLSEFERVRELFRYVEDADIWRWQLHNSKAFSSGLKDLNIEYNFRLHPSLFDQVTNKFPVENRFGG